jgi:hypothetical protein
VSYPSPYRWLGSRRRALTLALLAALSVPLMMTGAASAAVPPGFSSELIHVRFAEGTDVDPPTTPLTPALLASVDSITRLFSLSEADLNDLRAAGEAGSGESLPDLNLWFEIALVDGTDAEAFLSGLQALASVEVAEFAALPLPPTAVTPDFTANQGYRGPATDGIDAIFSATQPGGDGTGITIYDVEYNWLQTHEDLSGAAGVSLLMDAGDSISPPGYTSLGCAAPCDRINREHGTAVLGELIADDDSKGVTGLSLGADVELAPARTTNLGYNPANAILLSVADGQPGDVILIEQQVGVCGTGNSGPTEWMSDVFDAIQTAVANRFVVVEAAGNGGVNLDQAACGTTFDRTVKDSGAIMVGAGAAPGANDRQRLGISSYGDRVDVQGWGESIMTTGYGSGYVNADDPNNPDFFYRSTFGGTSGASAMVAAAAANLQGFAINLFGTPLLPFQVRQILAETGSPQLGDTTQNIGPRPDLQAAIARLTVGAIDLFILVDLSNSFTDDLPVFQAQAPGIINGIKAANANVRFGLAKYEDYPISPFGSAAAGDKAYERLVDLTFDPNAVLTEIAGLTTRSGGDLPQSQLPALFQAATGDGQDLSGAGHAGASIPAGQQANFRNGATKLFLLWTDAEFHLPGDPGDIPYPGPSFVEVVDAITALDPPQVIGISSGPDGVADLQAIAAATGAFAPAGGVDCDDDGAIDILEGEPLVCAIATSGEGIGAAIVTLVEAVIEAATPTALCMDVTVPTEPGVCEASASVDDGSFDPDGGPVDLRQSPPSPYPLGETEVTLRATDDTGLSDTCMATVTVVDVEAPTPLCNAPAEIVPPDAPISFAAGAEDNCDVADVVITGFDCFKFTKKGKRVDKRESCVVSVSDDTITIHDSGGVGDHITWTVVATDASGNQAATACEVVVANPGKGN